jgi:hypothetical protein
VSTESTTHCDICSKVKGATNGWWKAEVYAAYSVQEKKLLISHWHVESAGIDVCGMQCATQALARFMDHDNLEER